MSRSPDQIRVIHVDDEPGLRELTAQFLEREDNRFEVDTVPSASAGLDKLQGEEFDCVVSDYQMPRQNGLEFLAAVREEHSDLPFILFTGKGSEEIASKAITAGVTDYLQKGIGADQYRILANRIANVVEQHRAVRQTELSHRAMETASEGLSLVEPDGTFSYVNPAFAHLFGYDREELVGEHWTILYHNEEAARLETDILPAVRETGYWAGETVRLTKTGERLVTDHRLAHTDEDVIVCTAQNVTDERTAFAEQTGFDLLLDAIGDHMFLTLDHEGYVTRWNDRVRQVTGYEVDEILGEHLAAFFPEDERQTNIPEQLLETAKTEGSATDEGWKVRKDGSRFWADMTISASYDDTGTLRGFGQIIKESAEQATAQ